MKITLQGFCLEENVNNYMFVAIADLRPLNFEELLHLWPSALDQAEHDAIALLPLTQAVLDKCMNEDRLPASVWATIMKERLVRFAVAGTTFTEENQQWQPTSHLRLAAASWFHQLTS